MGVPTALALALITSHVAASLCVCVCLQFYTGDAGVDWRLARVYARVALSRRPDDGPLHALMRYMDSVGEGPDKTAPTWWKGYRVLDEK